MDRKKLISNKDNSVLIFIYNIRWDKLWFHIDHYEKHWKILRYNGVRGFASEYSEKSLGQSAKWIKEEKIGFKNETKGIFNKETSTIDLTMNPTFENETDYDSSVVADSTKLMLKQK